MTSVFPQDTIKDAAESLGLANLKPDVAAAVALDVDYRVQLVVQECVKFMRHAKRSRLTVNDVNNALRVQNIEPLYGFSSSRPLNYKKTNATGHELFYVDEEELDFDRVISAPLPSVPLDISYTGDYLQRVMILLGIDLAAHWLAIEGVQPAISQNPSLSDGRTPGAQKSNVGPLLSSQNEVEVKPLVRHVLSKELSLYYERIISSVLSPDSKLRNAALSSLRHDPGLHELTPYFTQFIYINISQNLANIAILERVLDMIAAILANENLFVELYLHQLMPAILTCMIGKRIGEDPTEDHWTVRDVAAELMTSICQRFSTAYHTLKPRICKTLLKAFLDPQKSLPTHYGAIIGLGSIGPEAIRGLLLPNIKSFGRLLDSESDTTPIRQMEIKQCDRAMMHALKNLAEYDDAPYLDNSGDTLMSGDTHQRLEAMLGTSFADLVLSEANNEALVRVLLSQVGEVEV